MSEMGLMQLLCMVTGAHAEGWSPKTKGVGKTELSLLVVLVGVLLHNVIKY